MTPFYWWSQEDAWHLLFYFFSEMIWCFSHYHNLGLWHFHQIISNHFPVDPDVLGGTLDCKLVSHLKSDVIGGQILQVSCGKWGRMAQQRDTNPFNRGKNYALPAHYSQALPRMPKKAAALKPFLESVLSSSGHNWIGCCLFVCFPLKNKLQNLHLNPWIQQKGG